MGCCGGGRGASAPVVTSSASAPAQTGISVITTSPGMTIQALQSQIAAYKAAKAKDSTHRRMIQFNGGPMSLAAIDEALNAPI